MDLKLLKRLYLLFLFIFLINEVYAQSVICPKELIEGFEVEHTAGLHYNGEANTTTIRNSKLYVTIHGDQIYIQSNFLPGAGAPYPIKLATVPQPHYSSILDYLDNIYYFGDDTHAISPSSISYLKKNLYDHVVITVDPSVIQSASFKDLGFEEFKKLQIACPDEQARPALHLLNNDGSLEYLIKYGDNISTRIEGQNLDYMLNNLAVTKMKFDDVKVLSLVDNSFTENIIATRFAAQKISFDFSSVDKFEQLLVANKDKRVIILGHIEEGEFVTIDKAGNERFKISIDKIQQLQEENNLQLILLGCNSALEGAKAGPINKFTSARALERLETTRNTETVKDFLDSLSFGIFHFVLDQTFFKNQVAAITHIRIHPRFIAAGFGDDDQAVDTTQQDTTTVEVPERASFSVFTLRPGTTKLNGKPAGTIMFLGLASTPRKASILPPVTLSHKGVYVFLSLIGLVVLGLLANKFFQKS